MFSSFINFISSFLLGKPEVDLDEDEEKILYQIRGSANVETEVLSHSDILEHKITDRKLLGHSDRKKISEEIVKCVSKVGTVTYLADDFGIINDFVYFESSQVSETLALKQKDDVAYTVYAAKENEVERVHKIYALKNDLWDSLNLNQTSEIRTLTRIINGRVIERRGRKLFIEPPNIWCSLDEIEASFVPIEGDWVSLEALVTINEEVKGHGDVLDVKSLKPVLEKSGFGRITFWSNKEKEGAIENQIYFTQIFCKDGYFPNLGDRVVYDAIESDQGHYKWRALTVIPDLNQKPGDQNSGKRNKDRKKKGNDKSASLNKYNISIEPSKCIVETQLHKTQEVVVEVINKGDVERILNGIKFSCHKDQSQLTQKLPKLNDPFPIKSKGIIKYVFECEGKFLGLTEEIVIFDFENFQLEKKIEIIVLENAKMNKLLSCKTDEDFSRNAEGKKYVKNIEASRNTYGKKSWRGSKFSTGGKKVYKSPSQLLSLLKKIKIEKGRFIVSASLGNHLPCLNGDLNRRNYEDRFHTLLFLEEIEITDIHRSYDMNGVYLQREDDFLVLKMPDLSEKKSFLFLGDAITATQSWSTASTVAHVGYVEDIKEDRVFIKFHPSFHNSYDGSECHIRFQPNISNFLKCHDAVDNAVKRLGFDFLFPSSVKQKPNKINFEFKNDPERMGKKDGKILLNDREVEKLSGMDMKDFECLVDEKGVVTPKEVLKRQKNPHIDAKKKIKVWFNKNLNERQKLAVASVLMRQACPLPYILFGPPGTGKTITVVEMMMQIYHLIPESRLLVAFPSNYAADLICELLIGSGNFKPGELVRLLSRRRAAEGLVPEILLPYCETATVNTDAFSSLQIEFYEKSRIVVGTSSCVGSLNFFTFLSNHFTHIFVDEAGQLSEPEILVPITFLDPKNGQLILSGDPQQLGPVCQSKVAERFGLGVSLLERFISTFPYARDVIGFPETSGYDPRFITKLKLNYRSLPEILSLPNQLFYNSELIATLSQTEGLESDVVKKLNFKTEKRSEPAAMIFHGIIGKNVRDDDHPSWYNPQELWQIVSYLKKCYTKGLTSEDIGIITPYSKQVSKLRGLLSSLKLSAPKIGTVEEFQGQERLVIILSMVRSCPLNSNSMASHSLDFVMSSRRLNVGLTRARALNIILANPILLSRDSHWKTVLEYCVKNGSYIGCVLRPTCENLRVIEKESKTKSQKKIPVKQNILI